MSQNALNKIRKLFPQVKHVEDADESIVITVTKKDNSSARKKEPTDCALARACIREKIADAAIIGLSYSWLIKGTKAIRYVTSVTVSREITSFDRHHDFMAGKNYRLQKVSESNKMGADANRKRRNNYKNRSKITNPPVRHHFTENIRTVR